MEAEKVNPNFITDDLEIIDIFRQLINSKEKLWTWQQIPNDAGVRPVHFSVIKKFDPMKKTVRIEPTTQDGFRFVKKYDVFVYSRKRNIAIKFKSHQMTSSYIIFNMPSRLNVLSRELAEKISIVEKENEQANMHLRTTPRKKTAAGFVSLIKNPDQPGYNPEIFNLYDISSGGMGFKINDPGEFIKGMKVKIVNINGKELDKSMYGEVMSVREMPDEMCFKVGVKFD